MNPFPTRGLFHFFGFLLVLFRPGMVLCSENSSRFVRRVDFSAAPQAELLAAHARELANRLYPQVCELLADDHSRFWRRFDICFKNGLFNDNSGQTRLNQICLNARYLEQWTNDPGSFDSVLVHEMAHVAQHYEHQVIGKWLLFRHNTANWLVEGIADYVSFKLGETNGWRCAECSAVFPDYRDGYSCAAAFLMYLETTYNGRIVQELNSRLRHGGFSEGCFVSLTGKKLDALWSEFQKTAAFTPAAARMLELEKALGYQADKPPKDFDQRFNQFLAQSVDAPTWRLLTEAKIAAFGNGKYENQMAILNYFTQPGGTAEAFITRLKSGNELPGFARDEHGTLTGAVGARDLTPKYPVTRSFTATKLNDPASVYHYEVTRSSQDAQWQLLRAWQTDARGKTVQEFPVKH